MRQMRQVSFCPIIMRFCIYYRRTISVNYLTCIIYFVRVRENNCLISIVTLVLTNSCISKILFIPLQKYDKPCVRESIRNCPLKCRKIGIFFVRVENKFCTRTKNICIAMPIFFIREENLPSSFFAFFMLRNLR